MNWQNFHTIFLRICGILALISNALMFQLICYSSPRNLGAYKYLMIYFAVFEFLYAILDMILLPDVYTLNSAFLVAITSERSHIPPTILPAANVMYWFFFGLTLALINVHFVFRYLVVKGTKVWTSSKPSTLLIWLILPLSCGALHSYGCRLFFGPTRESDRFFKEIVFNNTEPNFYAMGFYLFPKNENGTEFLNWMSVYGVLEIVVGVSVSYSIMLLFGIKCYKIIQNLQSQKSGSSQYRKIQKQLFLALVLQTIIPILLMFIPSAIILVFLIMDQSSELHGKMFGLSVALYPVFDPLPNMLIIDCYRNAIRDYCRKIFCLKSKQVTIQPTRRHSQSTSL